MRNDREFIIECAAKGVSKSRTAELLGFWPSSFPGYLEVMGLTGLEWVNGHISRSAMEGRQRSGQSRSGVPQLYLTDADRERKRQGNLNRAPKHTAFGVTAALSELVAQFSSLSKETVRRRISLGMTIEEALTTPKMLPTPPKNTDSHPWKISNKMGFENLQARRANK